MRSYPLTQSLMVSRAWPSASWMAKWLYPSICIWMMAAFWSMVRCPFDAAGGPSCSWSTRWRMDEASQARWDGSVPTRNQWWEGKGIMPTQYYIHPNINPHYWSEWPWQLFQFKLWMTITFLNLNEIGQIKRHEKAEIKGYPSAFSGFKIGFSKKLSAAKVSLSCRFFVRV